MAGVLLRGATKATAVIAQGHQIGSTVKTSAPNIQKHKDTALGGLGLFYGFVPVMPACWPAQVPLFIILVLIFAFFFQLGWKTSFLSAYVIQALVVAYFYSKIVSGLSSILFGI